MSEADDKAQKIIDKMNSTYEKAGATQFAVAIGQATLALIERGEQVTVESLIAYLQQQITPDAHRIVKSQNTAAEKALRDADAKRQ